ncbi:MAG: DeoR/GlpR family DNA-binding transcription regulator [Nocardioidaceae bacterium]|nr:DeoR/GlpR family DNA-binding transcription regulator [Nocardioidaceae bacterium]
MYPQERQRTILALAQERGEAVGAAEISELLGVTTETVRRDLEVLERQGAISRVRGGAVLTPSLPFELALAERQRSYAAEKRAIARAVVEQLPSDGVVALDSGSLTSVVASMMPTDRRLIVVTNNLPAARVMASMTNLEVLVLPGRVRGVTSAVVDTAVVDRLATLHVDLAIVGTNALSIEHGLTTTVPEEAATKGAMVRCARRRLVPVVSERFGRTSFCHFADLADIDVVVTDDGLGAEVAEAVSACGPDIVRAPVQDPRSSS